MTDSVPIRVLVIDDDEDDFVLARDMLRDIDPDRYETTWESSCEAARPVMAANEHDVYLLDYRLGAEDGLTLLNDAILAGCHQPIILLTGQGDRDIDLKAMRLGATDYLVKGRIDGDLLERAIRYALERTRLEREVREKQEQLDHARRYDSATGFLHAHLFMDQLVSETSLATRHGYSLLLSLAVLVVENEAEDEPIWLHDNHVSSLVSRTLRESLGNELVIGHYGRDGFGIIFSGQDIDQASSLMERLKARIANTSFTLKDGTTLPITLAYGISTKDPQMTVGAFVRSAHRALMAAIAADS